MLEQAYDLGLSHDRDIGSLLPIKTAKLQTEWDDSVSRTPNFHDGSFDQDLGLVDSESIDLRQLVVDALGSLACKELWKDAVAGETYSRLYQAGSEGTGFHNDSSTNYDLFVVHTLYGRADFGATRRDGYNFIATMGPGSVIAFSTDTLHYADPPIGGPREIEGVPIKLNGDLSNSEVYKEFN